MLTNWNFSDEPANATTQQINRQKSARNLEILQFDASEPRAVYFDPKRNQARICREMQDIPLLCSASLTLYNHPFKAPTPYTKRLRAKLLYDLGTMFFD